MLSYAADHCDVVNCLLNSNCTVPKRYRKVSIQCHRLLIIIVKTVRRKRSNFRFLSIDCLEFMTIVKTICLINVCFIMPKRNFVYHTSVISSMYTCNVDRFDRHKQHRQSSYYIRTTFV